MSSPKRPRDTNQLAKMVVDIATGDAADHPKRVAEKGRPGGLVGGHARAKTLTPGRRVEIAKTAARKRWAKDSVEGE